MVPTVHDLQHYNPTENNGLVDVSLSYRAQTLMMMLAWKRWILLGVLPPADYCGLPPPPETW